MYGGAVMCFESPDSALQQMVQTPGSLKCTKHLSLPGLQAIAIVFYMICEIINKNHFVVNFVICIVLLAMDFWTVSFQHHQRAQHSVAATACTLSLTQLVDLAVVCGTARFLTCVTIATEAMNAACGIHSIMLMPCR